jgi:uroporphyrinogen-III synthase
MFPEQPRGLDGLRIVAFEARRASELAVMLARHGATVCSAPALREAPLPPSARAGELRRALETGAVGALVLLTGVGTRGLARLLADVPSGVAALFARTRIVARGPKPFAALRELGVPDAIAVPSPHTSREVLGVIDGLGLAAGSLLAVQEYGAPPRDLYDGLAARGFSVLAVPVYEWALPEDPRALRGGVDALVRGEIDVAVFTSAVQVAHAFRIAADPDGLRRALARVVVASVGPVCSEALEAHGVAVDLEATPPKLGPLVASIAREAAALAAAKRRASGG